MEKKTGLLSFTLSTTKYPWAQVKAAFDGAGLSELCPVPPTCAGAFINAIAMLDKRGGNAKVRNGVNPLRQGYQVFFRKTWQNVGKSEIACDILDAPAGVSSSDAVCRQVVQFHAPNTITFHKPTNLPTADYDPDYMRAHFLATYQECTDVDSEAIRRVLHGGKYTGVGRGKRQTHKAGPLALLQPLWINKHIVCWFPIENYHVAQCVETCINSLQPNDKVYLEKLDFSEPNPSRIETFVAAVKQHVGTEVANVRKALKPGKDTRDATYTGLSEGIKTLRDTVSYYQMLLEVGNDVISTYVSELDTIEHEIKASMQAAIAGKDAPQSTIDLPPYRGDLDASQAPAMASMIVGAIDPFSGLQDE